MVSLPIVSENYYVKSPFQFSLRLESIQDVPPGHYLIQLEACGICRSDLLWLSYRSDSWEKIGHEFGGRVVKCGDGALQFREGQRVAVKNAAPCQRCPECLDGKPRLCRSVIVNKSGHDQYFLADERSLTNSDGIDKPLLGVVEPLGVAHEVVAAAHIEPGDSVLVFGLGVIGLLVGRLCSLRGVDTVIGLARHSRRFALAEQFGFSACFESDAKDLVQNIQDVCPGLPNKILLCAPPGCLNEVMPLVRKEGKIVIAGLNEETWGYTTPFDFEKLIFKHATITGAFAYPNLYFEEAVELIRRDSNIIDTIISQTCDMSDLPEMMQKIHSDPHAYLKVVLMR